MTAPDWTPSPPLANAVREALAGMARQWPRAMGLAREHTDDAQAFLGDYAAAMQGVDLRAIPLAAREWVASQNMPPRPAEFGKLARDLTRTHFPRVFDDATRRGTTPAETPPTDKDLARIDLLGARAFDVLRSWPLVAETWAWVVSAATDPNDAEAARNGAVPSDVWDEAVDMVRRGKRVPLGPLRAPVRDTVRGALA